MDSDVTLILQAAVTEGLPSEDLLPLVYDELRSLAAARMKGEAPGQTLQATALVHDAWIRVSKNPRLWNDRAHFFRVAALEMRRILVENARAKARLKRGGGNQERVDIGKVDLADPAPDDRVLLVDEMLKRMETEDPDSARIITLKFFGGLTNKEVAAAEGTTERTVERRWAFARTRLFDMMNPEL